MNRYFALPIIAIVFLCQWAFAEQSVQVTWLDDSLAVVSVSCGNWTNGVYYDSINVEWLGAIDSIQNSKGVIVDLREIDSTCEQVTYYLAQFLDKQMEYNWPRHPANPGGLYPAKMFGYFPCSDHCFFGPILVLHNDIRDYLASAALKHICDNRTGPTRVEIASPQYGLDEAKRDLKELILSATKKPDKE